MPTEHTDHGTPATTTAAGVPLVDLTTLLDNLGSSSLVGGGDAHRLREAAAALDSIAGLLRLAAAHTEQTREDVAQLRGVLWGRQ